MKHLGLILVAFLLTTPALAKRGKGGGHAKIFKQLDLSKEQKAELKEIRQSRKEKMKALKQEKKEARKKFHEAMSSNASSSTLKSLHKKMLNAVENFKTYRFETMLKTRKVLNDSQRKKFHELKSEQFSSRRKHRQGDED